ncbi:hypothetical protein [Phormidesmis sp. 146-33]
MNQPTFRDVYRLYLIVADFPGELPRVIGRTCHKIDADDHVRFLKRKAAQGNFYVAFDPEPQKLNRDPVSC